MRGLVYCWCLVMFQQLVVEADAAWSSRVLEAKLVHLRSGSQREWSEFPATPDGPRLRLVFSASKNPTKQTLSLRQQDVKQAWRVVLNGQKVGELVRDENDMKVVLSVPENCLVDGDNTLEIESPAATQATSDDIRVGEITLVDVSLEAYLKQSQLEIEVVDRQSRQPLPCRITIIDDQGAMQSLSVNPAGALAARPGVVFTADGHAAVGLPAGHYTVFAGRGFEYSLDREEVTLEPGNQKHMKLRIQREVPTYGYVASDTHVHTLTHSGHGDATIEERVITLAGEGVELPIATDHNKFIDLTETASRLGVRSFFTPVTGCEVTTPRGHFNVFPIAAGAALVDHKQTDWSLLFDEIEQTPGVKLAILNHARDLHSGVRPFAPEFHRALVGENIAGWPLRFNAMEVINSGAVQTDPYRLFGDWMGLLNGGLTVTPIGSSDSHDVGRHFVGQGRTYVRVGDQDPGNIDIAAAVDSFVAGRVSVSYGLMTEIKVNGQYQSGELATNLNEHEVQVDVRVLGPHWTRASQVRLLANGLVIREAEIPEMPVNTMPPGIKWTGSWKIPKPKHDVFLVALANGPGIDGFYWRTAKPYQPLSPDWHGCTLGCSGAVWLDVDNDRLPTPARKIAERLVAAAGSDWSKLIERLAPCDEAIAAQVAHVLSKLGQFDSDELRSATKLAAPATLAGFQAYRAAVRETELAQANR